MFYKFAGQEEAIENYWRSKEEISLNLKKAVHRHMIIVQFSRSVVSDSLWPHGLQHPRPPCPSPTPRGYSNSCPSSQSRHSSPHPLSSPSPPAFSLSQHQDFFKWVSSSHGIGVSASASVLSMNTQDWAPLGWTGWISLQSTGLSRVFSSTTAQEHQFFGGPLLE